MHGRERHEIILSMVSDRLIASIAELVAATGASEATIRRDIAGLDASGRVRRIRGGAEAKGADEAPRELARLTLRENRCRNTQEKQAIAREAAALCADGEPIIINGGATTFQMVHPLTTRNLQVMTNSFPIAEHLLKNSRNSVLVPGGLLYREQNIILSPFNDDASQNYWARRMFMGAHGVGPKGVMEADPLLIQAQEKLLGKSDELVLLVDSSKFRKRSGFVLCPIERVDVLITDEYITDEVAQWIENAGVHLIVASVNSGVETESSQHNAAI